MARQYNSRNSQYPNDDSYGSNPYASNDGSSYDSPYGSPYSRQRQGDPYGRQGRERNPYDSPYSRQGYAQQGHGSASPYDNASASPYGQGARDVRASSRTRGGRGGAQQPTAYPAGAGRTYASSRSVPQAAGVNPVTSRDYLSHNKVPSVDRRTFLIAAAGSVAAAAALGIVGTVWWNHRAVACTVNGTERDAPVGSSAQDLVDRGYAAPQYGNLVSIPDENGEVEVLAAGGGEPFALTVNGEPADPATWRLKAGDDVQFTNGADVTEEVTQQNTEIPFKAQIPQDGSFLVKIGYVAQWGRPGVSTVETGTVSGRTYDRGVTQEPQDFIIACAESINPADGRKLVALTFDDGPDPSYTPQYLDILARYGAHATFFNLGSAVDAGPEYAALSKRCADEGHQVASHTYSHLDLLRESAESVKNDLDKAFSAVSNATGVPTNVMRPPYGNFYGNTFLTYLKGGGDIAYSAYWGVDSDDWGVAQNGSGIEDGAQQIINNCTVNLAADNYNGAVILMHDSGGNRDRNVAALPGLIEKFQSFGYELVTMNELLASCGTFPEWVTSGYATRPEGAQLPNDTTEITYYDPYTYNPLAQA